MSYTGGGMYDAKPCPECGSILWNGRCENPDCVHHWKPLIDDEEEPKKNDEEDD